MQVQKFGGCFLKNWGPFYTTFEKIKGEHLKLGLKFSVFSLYAYDLGLAGVFLVPNVVAVLLGTTFLRQCNKFHRNQLMIHPVIAFSRNSIWPLPAVLE